MLRELRIRNYAILDEASLVFREGLNVITGETGAGKSVVLEALGLALGDRASRERVRSGADEAVVELVLDGVDGEALARLGIDAGEELIVRRHISLAGRSRIFLSGTLSTVQNLRDVLENAVDVHGQFEHQALLAENRQLGLLDAAGGNEADVAELGRRFGVWRRLSGQLEEFHALQRERAQRVDILRYQAEEIEAAELSPGEDEALEVERARLANAERLAEAAGRGWDLLRNEDNGAVERLHGAVAFLDRILAIDASAADALGSLQEAITRAEDAADYLRDYAEGIEHSPGRLDEVIRRVDLIDRLKKKYGSTIGEILAFGERARNELEAIEHPEQRLRDLEAEEQEVRGGYERLAGEISKRRGKAAASFGRAVGEALRDLAIPGGRFEIEMRTVDPGPAGRDAIRFLFSANPGEPLLPLAKIASGGELSRVMLAIKGVLGDSTPVLVFDEVDVGIGGEAAVSVGKRLKALAKDHQVICVTHQPSVAARGTHHLRIRKRQKDDRTVVEVEGLNRKERVEELARMLGGTPSTVSRKHAEELLAAGS